ncbi:MAG: penicillin-insensitive murein endopeptidase [Polyangiales bacterium]
MRGAALAWMLAGLGCSAEARRPVVTPPPAPKPAVAAPMAEAAPEPASAEAPPVLPPASASTSIGSPTHGRLVGGVPLPRSGPGYRFNDRRGQDARYATVEVVRAIVGAAARVQLAHPDAELVVNDVGLPGGGPIPHHGSHRAGRDADILFFLRDVHGAPMPSVGAPIDPEGAGTDYQDLARADDDVPVRFDAARTWRFVWALLEEGGGAGDAEVQRIFVAEHLRAMLLEAAETSGAPADVVRRFTDVSCQPGYPHDDHLHVRWFCSFEDLRAGCVDVPPIYPWRAEALATAGVVAARVPRATAREPSEVVTQAAAEQAARAQRPHSDVLAFLARRKAWAKQPHPGRPWCR